MKKIQTLWFCAFLLAWGGCGNKAYPNDGRITTKDTKGRSEKTFPKNNILKIDVSEKHGNKEIIYLQDIADISYIPLETNDTILLDDIRNFTITDKHILAHNKKEGSIFLFNPEGKIIGSFNRKGASGKEYMYCGKVTFDEEKKEIYVADDIRRKKILVYNFDGSFIRSIPTFTTVIDGLMNVNDKWLFCYDMASLMFVEKKDSLGNFRLISKDSGKQKILLPEQEEEQTNTIKGKDGTIFYEIFSFPYSRNGEEILLADLASDTIYRIINDKIAPYIIKENTQRNLLVTPYLKTKEHIYLYAIEKVEKSETFRNRRIISHNLQTGETRDVSFKNKDMKNKAMEDKTVSFLNSLVENRIQNCGIEVYPAHTLIKLNEKGQLTGELKKIASTLKEDDNPVIMMVKFKF